ncbi:chromosome segregation protein SMC [Bacteroidales bacterium]|nr:chromosome segregation protein SMC [Bacteroidales bacterium]
MIHKLILRNFKKIRDEEFLFDNFNLVVGANNSGKSSVLQALAIWQYCVDQFRLSRKKGGGGIQLVLPNFTALPLPEFNLLWTDKTDREYKNESGTEKKRLQYILISIDVYWKDAAGVEQNFCVEMRYQAPQSVYAIPREGWKEFASKDESCMLPQIVYVPPFSGLEPHEKWMDDGNIRESVGKAQPGSILRNLLYRVVDRKDETIGENDDWREIKTKISEWFNVKLEAPKYRMKFDTEITSEYTELGKKPFDIISGGSGFHQILTLLAFMYGYQGVTTILFDEPDAHLHINLQRKIIEYLKSISKIQFLIATHSEEFIKSVEKSSIISIMSGKAVKIDDSTRIIAALSLVDNIDIVRTQDSPYILYLEGEDDERILSAWAEVLGKRDVYDSFYHKTLGGGSKEEMKKKSDLHYNALKQYNTNLMRLIILDYDTAESFHPKETNTAFFEWKRKNIDNYLFVPSAWKRAVSKIRKEPELSLFTQSYLSIIDVFFLSQNLTLPTNQEWKNISADIFSVLDGKKLLFEQQDSLFRKLEAVGAEGIKVNRLAVASEMLDSEIHNDVVALFDKLSEVMGTNESEI